MPNDVVLCVADQYDTALPFFAVPIGGPPRYRYDIKAAPLGMNISIGYEKRLPGWAAFSVLVE